MIGTNSAFWIRAEFFAEHSRKVSRIAQTPQPIRGILISIHRLSLHAARSSKFKRAIEG